MKDSTIKSIGKLTFFLTFLLGSICFFGFYLTMLFEFIVAGSFVISLGTIVNGIVFFGLLIYGSFHQSQFKVCVQSALILLINIPIAFLYALLT
ncbi:hypothetical protein [Chryseobacterium daecheongense]|uniref:Uncharacterized protein n=1 Tax=Chryseobacterium daecheongense TaxID=192389 RepID=A0A3N0VRV6_9FLAO|nr:hypothetical protein [Chryseobacterium daecheongense]ROH95546.1 hypothetical protein EGI05_13505 [Chryseobacterium daecheongense]TDX92079.1 hypothetical protein BCF50_3221 [Chryseobacterium daecheongense]UOU98789.1 hypothetical protein MUU74_02295 [Chryseobacterium daecheongense]